MTELSTFFADWHRVVVSRDKERIGFYEDMIEFCLDHYGIKNGKWMKEDTFHKDFYIFFFKYKNDATEFSIMFG